MRGRTLIGTGTWLDSYGTITYSLGDLDGERKHKLSISEIPSHSHSYIYWSQYGSQWDYGERSPGATSDAVGTTSAVGGDQAHNNMQPYMAINWIIKI